ncbi:MAG: hypothetical protein RIR97_2116 [Pseudomonadota bacterium]
MSAATLARAPSGVSWSGINWAEAQRQVRGLQVRIVKALKEGRHNKVKALQWLLTHSFYGKALAVKRVTENQGKNTPGVDKVVWKTPGAKINAIASLKRRGYSPLPLRRIYIPKKNSKMRPLGIPAMKCRAMQALYLLALEPVAETRADPNSYGFRSARATKDAAEQCFKALAGKNRAQWVLEADIQGCFDNISHDWLMTNIPMDKVMLRKWLKAGYVFQNELFPTESGTPQGGIISPVLANMVLDGLEAMLATLVPPASGKGKKMHMVRFADDFIITSHDKTRLEQEVKPAVEAFLAKRGLVLSPEKTKITHITEGFDFLGWNLRKYNGKLLIKPSKANVKVHLDHIRGIIKAHMTAKQANLIRMLNPVIRGWTNYHSHAVAKASFARNDHMIWSMLWRWAVLRHPNKNARWIKNRYFTVRGARRWVFSDTEKQEDGTTKELTLLLESDTPIVRHVKIRAQANPYDPDWESYFEARWDRKMRGSIRGQIKLYRLWSWQGGRCTVCGEIIGVGSHWATRHKVTRATGGTDALSNLEMRHPQCWETGNDDYAEGKPGVARCLTRGLSRVR